MTDLPLVGLGLAILSPFGSSWLYCRVYSPPPTPPPTVTTTEVASTTLTSTVSPFVCSTAPILIHYHTRSDPPMLVVTTTKQSTEVLSSAPRARRRNRAHRARGRWCCRRCGSGHKKASGKAFQRDGNSDEKQSGSEGGLSNPTQNGQGQMREAYEDGQGQLQLVLQPQYAQAEGQGVQYIPQANGSYHAMQVAPLSSRVKIPFKTCLDCGQASLARLSQVTVVTLNISVALPAVPGSSLVGSTTGVKVGVIGRECTLSFFEQSRDVR